MTTQDTPTLPSDGEILHTWDEFVNEPSEKYPLTDLDKIAFARALLARYGAVSQEPISDMMLACIFQLYDDALDKARAGRVFDNPARAGSLEYKAWEMGTERGNELRSLDGAPVAAQEPADTRCNDCKLNSFSWCPHNQPEPEWRKGRPCKGMNCGAMRWQRHSPECAAEHAAAIAGGRFTPGVSSAPQPPTSAQPAVDPDFVADLARSRAKYLGNARMFDGLMGEIDELRRAYAGDGDIRAEAFDVAACAYRIATEGDTGGNTLLEAAQPRTPDGWKLVPVEPTPEWMANLERLNDGVEMPAEAVAECVRELLAASPTPPADGQAQQETCKTCQGNGEIVTDWERYQHPHNGDKGDEAVAECPDCDGQGTVEPAQQDADNLDRPYRDTPEDGYSHRAAIRAQQDVDAEAANTGHGHVFPRPDNVKMRCGGPGICPECSRDAARAQQGGQS